MKLYSVIAACILLFACSSSKQTIQPYYHDIKKLKFLGEHTIPYNAQFKGTTVGGLSSIDYDAKHNLYYMISDDKSELNPARFYTAKIHINNKGVDSINVVDAKYLLQPNDSIYPSNKQDKHKTPDPEAMRYNPLTQQLVWSSEGERVVNVKDTILLNPTINFISTKGKFIDSISLPPNLYITSIEKGPRRNAVLEGLSFADNYKTIWTSVEEPLYEDGPRADTFDNNALIRLYKFDAATKKNIAQYAYKLDAVAHPANPSTAFKLNGVSDILYIGNNKLLTVERSFSAGTKGCVIKVFIADVSNADNIINVESLKNSKPATKKLLLNMDNLGIYIDNIEGVTLGPMLPNGKQSLIFIADNNFMKESKTQFLLFEIED